MLEGQGKKLVATFLYFIPYLIVAQSVPTRTALDPLPLRASTCSLIRAFRRLTINDHNAISLALLACQILVFRGVSSSTRTPRFSLGGKQTYHDRLRSLVPLSVVHKTRLRIQVQGRIQDFRQGGVVNE